MNGIGGDGVGDFVVGVAGDVGAVDGITIIGPGAGQEVGGRLEKVDEVLTGALLIHIIEGTSRLGDGRLFASAANTVSL